MLKAIGYVRVSTKDQDENNQKLSIMKFAEKNDIEIMTWYVDKGESRMKSWRKRPGAIEMIRFLESGGKDIVDAVVVFDFTRLGASMLDIFDLFNKLEKELGVRVISVHDEWLQTRDESLRKLLIAIFSWMSEQELKLRRERQKSAWESGKQKGRPEKMTKEQIKRYVKRYPELAKHNKKALWYIVRHEGHDISYTRFLVKVNQILKELGWW